MSNALATTQSTALIEFDNEQMDLIKRTIAQNATNDELSLFMYQCKRTGLDPLARQIHFQKFVSRDGSSNVSFITTIDGYRLIADRTGKYVGSDEPVFEGRVAITDGNQYDHNHAPAKATVTVKKLVANIVCEFTASAYWTEYYPGGKRGHMWRKMPHVMLAKVAEAAALRKGFPNDLSGVYTDDEMGQAGADVSFANEVASSTQKRIQKQPDVVEGVVEEPSPKPAGRTGDPMTAEALKAYMLKKAGDTDEQPSEKQLIAVRASLSKAAKTTSKRKQVTSYLFATESTSDLTKGQAGAILAWLGANNENEYTPDPISVQELERVCTAYLKQAGQAELIPSEPPATGNNYTEA
jgi:phage recombination protein Bet